MRRRIGELRRRLLDSSSRSRRAVRSTSQRRGRLIFQRSIPRGRAHRQQRPQPRGMHQRPRLERLQIRRRRRSGVIRLSVSMSLSSRRLFYRASYTLHAQAAWVITLSLIC